MDAVGVDNMNMSSLFVVLLLIGALNISDYFFTIKAMELGFTEGNPVMNMLVDTKYFTIVKLILVPMGLLVLWKAKNQTSKYGLLLAVLLICYVSVNIYHAYGLFSFFFIESMAR